MCVSVSKPCVYIECVMIGRDTAVSPGACDRGTIVFPVSQQCQWSPVPPWAWPMCDVACAARTCRAREVRCLTAELPKLL